MRKIWPVWLIILLLAAGCSIGGSDGPSESGGSGSNTVIDWVDFVKVGGNQYESLYSLAVADPKHVTDEVIGKVEFTVSGNISDPGYRIKDGDAAFLPVGTPLYAIEGLDPERFAAAEDDSMIHGYKVYFNRENEEGRTWHYRDLDQDAVVAVEVYTGYTAPEKLAEFSGESVKDILMLLNESKQDSSYMPSTAEGDPAEFRLIFYDGSRLAQVHRIYRDDLHYYWSPWDTNIIDDAIGAYLEK